MLTAAVVTDAVRVNIEHLIWDNLIFLEHAPNVFQGQGLSQIPLFNGVGPYPLQEGPGFGSSSIGGSGDGLQNMWNSLDTPDSEDITEKGVSEKKKV